MTEKKVAVVGAGPAGMLAAAYACGNGVSVDLYDGNEKAGKKLYLTGKGRCNITNIASKDEFLRNVPRNPRFLFSCLDAFYNDDIISLINSQGVPTKVERGGRVFPESDKSSDVIRALAGYAQKKGVNLILGTRVKAIASVGELFCVSLESGRDCIYDYVVIATGGKSYPSTGSTGDGYTFAGAFNHTIITPLPSLVSLNTVEKWAGELAGLSLKNVKLYAYSGSKCLYSELGEMLFTHSGISGPLVLSASARIADNPNGIRIVIDMKPALDAETLDARLVRDIEQNKHKRMKNAIAGLLPQRMIPIVLDAARVDAESATDTLKKSERRAIVTALKSLTLTVRDTAGIEEAVITRGGISVKEIDPRTMESRLVKGLYFAGELIDVDAFTGGYNLQIAYSTGVAAGRAIAALNGNG